MADSPRHAVQFRRRRTGKTDYGLRVRLVRSGKQRVVVRNSNRYVYVQVTEAYPSGDTVRASASSRELASLGWKGATGNIPSAYLTGLVAGQRAVSVGVKQAILDSGLRRSTKGSRIYASVRGLVDAGLVIPHSDEVLPSTERIQGAHIADYSRILFSKEVDAYKKHFRKYLAAGSRPEDLLSHFETVKRRILSSAQETSAN